MKFPHMRKFKEIQKRFIPQYILLIIILMGCCGICLADRLPSQVPENQIFTIDTLIDATGSITEKSYVNWVLDDQNLEFMIENAPDLLGDSWNAVWLIDFIYDYGGTIEMFDLLSIIRGYDGVEIVTVGPDDPYYDWGVPVLSLKVPETLYNTVITPDMPGLTFMEMLDRMEEGYHVAYAYNRLLEYDKGHIHDGRLNPTEEIAILNWMDSIRTNGGKISLNKNIGFDSTNKAGGLSNLESEKVVSFSSIEGAHLTGSETWNLDVAGNWERTENSIRCVFASSSDQYLPAFCNVVKAKSDLVNLNSGKISTKGSTRMVAASADIPAALNYQIAVTPDANAGSGVADGTVKTLFGGSIMEAREKNDEPSATNSWRDEASVSGGIRAFQKSFEYESGFFR